MTYMRLPFLFLCLLLIYPAQKTHLFAKEQESQPVETSKQNSNQVNKQTTPDKTNTPDTPTITKPTIIRIPGYPPVEKRVAEYRQLVKSRKKLDESEPYLIEGITVTGIFATEHGYGAFLKTEDGNTVIVKKGTKMYNGIVAAVEKDKVLFRSTKSKKLIEKFYGQDINANQEEPVN